MPELGRHPDEPDRPDTPDERDTSDERAPGRGADHRSDYLDARAAADNPAFDRTTPDRDTFRQERPEPNDHPTGEELADPEEINDDAKLDKLLKKTVKDGSNTVDATGKTTDSVQGLLKQNPPTGHAEVRAPSGTMEVQHHAVNTADTASALMVLGVLAGEGLRKGRKIINDKREKQ